MVRQGTNTYLIGKRPPWILVDTGEGKEEYLGVLEEALLQDIAGYQGPLVSDILLTHRHADHVGGVPSVLALLRRLWRSSNPYEPPRIHKYPLLEPSIFIRKSTLMVDDCLEVTQSALEANPQLFVSSEKTSSQHPYYHDLADEQRLVASDGCTTLRVLYTPGHTADSVTLLLIEENVLFTGDTVLGAGTAVFEDLGQYMRSLKRMLTVAEQSSGNEGTSRTRLYPGHGPVVDDGPRVLSEYISHRQERERQIVELMRTKPDDHWEIWTIVKTIYASYPEEVWRAAAAVIGLHLKKLEEDGVVKHEESVPDDPMSGYWILIDGAGATG